MRKVQSEMLKLKGLNILNFHSLIRSIKDQIERESEAARKILEGKTKAKLYKSYKNNKKNK